MVSSSKENPLLASLIEALATPASHLIYLYGQEAYLIEQALSLLQKTILTEATKDFNYEILSGKESSATKIISSACTLPMMASKRLVIVKEANELSTEALNQLLSYVDHPSLSTCLCFVAEKVDLRLRFFTLFKKKGVLLKFDPLTDRQLPSFLKAEAKKFQLSFEEGAIEKMIEQVGSDLGQIHEKMIQLSCYIEPRKIIQKSDIDELILPSAAGGIFDLMDSVFKQDDKAAFPLLKKLLSQKEPVLRIFSLISRQIRLLTMTKAWINSTSRISSVEIAKELAVPPFVAIKLIEQTKELSKETLFAMQEKLYETEKLLKNSRMDGEYYLEQLIIFLLRKNF